MTIYYQQTHFKGSKDLTNPHDESVIDPTAYENHYDYDAVIVANDNEPALHLRCLEAWSMKDASVRIQVANGPVVTVPIIELIQALAVSGQRQVIISETSVHLMGSGTGPHTLAEAAAIEKEAEIAKLKEQAAREQMNKEVDKLFGFKEGTEEDQK